MQWGIDSIVCTCVGSCVRWRKGILTVVHKIYSGSADFLQTGADKKQEL